jgi:hypothetical protein
MKKREERASKLGFAIAEELGKEEKEGIADVPVIRPKTSEQCWIDSANRK